MLVLTKCFPTKCWFGGTCTGVHKLLPFSRLKGSFCSYVGIAHILLILLFLPRFIPGEFLPIKTKMDKQLGFIEANFLGYNY